jgi:hypothetical protein
MSNSNWRGYRTAAWVGVALLVGAIMFTLVQGQWMAAAPLVGFVAVAILFIKLEDRLPTLFDLLFVIAALVNAGGWAFKWYNTIGLYDEIAHGFTTFALTLACGYLAYRKMLTNFHDHRLLFVLTVASFGIAIGALWEIAEWVSDFFVASTVVESIDDIIDDLILDSLGAIIAGILSLWALHDHARGETTADPSSTPRHDKSPRDTSAVTRQKLTR